MSSNPPYDIKSLRCRLQPTGFSKKNAWKKEPEDKVTGVVRFLSKHDADEELKDRPPGSVILRLRGTSALDTGKSTELKVLLKIKVKPDSQLIICKVDPKIFKWIQSTLIPFLEQVTPFINEFCQNKNFVESDLDELALEKELTFRKFVIYSENMHITVLKKADLKRHGPKSFSVAIDFNECRFVAIKNSGETFIRTNSFNESLLEFLNIRSTDTFLVMGALGYNPKELKENVTRDRTYSFTRNRQTPIMNRGGPGMSGKEREELISMISMVGIAGVRELPDQVLDALVTTHSALEALDNQPADKAWDAKIVQAEKMGWIHGGIFSSLIGLAVAAASESNFPDQLKLPLDIIKLLLKNFTWACERFYDYLWAHHSSMSSLTDDQGPLAICYLISEVISVSPFGTTFLQLSGVDRLVNLFTQTVRHLTAPPGQKLLDFHSSSTSARNSSGAVKPIPFSSSTAASSSNINNNINSNNSNGTSNAGSKSVGSGTDKVVDHFKAGNNSTTNRGIIKKLSKSRMFSSSKDKKKETSSPQRSSESDDPVEEEPIQSPKRSVPVPVLNLGTQSSKGVYSGRSQRRKSVPKMNPLHFLSDDHLQESTTSNSFSETATATEELAELARRTGQTHVASDLSVMLSYKQRADVRARRRLTRMPDLAPKDGSNMMAPPDEDALAKMGLVTLDKKPPHYQIRCYILKTLAVLAEDPKFRKVARSPVNLIYTQLTTRELKSTLEGDDGSYRKLLYRVLQSTADEVEIIHARHWGEHTKGMSTNQIVRYRQKLDLLTWRVHQRIQSSLQKKNFEDLEAQLRVLGEYLAYCSSRVIASQVVDVCIDTLLSVKNYLFRLQFDPTNIRLLKLIHLLLRVFDEIASHSILMPMNDLLLTMLAYKAECWNYIKDYCYELLTNPQLECAFLQDEENGGGSWLTPMRVQIIRHYTAILGMIQRQYQCESQDKLTVLLARDSVQTSLMKKFEFLVKPTSILQKILQDGNQYSDFAVKKEILRFLHKLFASPYCVYTTDQAYVDSYISFHYMQVIKLYNNYALDTPTIRLCKGHLKILIDFASHKANNAALKFYQLRTVDFLTHEVSLEYEIKVKRKKFLQDIAKKEAESHAKPLASSGSNNNSSGNNSNNTNNPHSNSSSSSSSTTTTDASTSNSGFLKAPSPSHNSKSGLSSLLANTQPPGSNKSSGGAHGASILSVGLKIPDHIPNKSKPSKSPNNVSSSSGTSPIEKDPNSSDATTPLSSSGSSIHPKALVKSATSNDTTKDVDSVSIQRPKSSVELSGLLSVPSNGNCATAGETESNRSSFSGSPNSGRSPHTIINSSSSHHSVSSGTPHTKPRANSVGAPDPLVTVPKLDLNALEANREGSSRPRFLMQHPNLAKLDESISKRQKRASLDLGKLSQDEPKKDSSQSHGKHGGASHQHQNNKNASFSQNSTNNGGISNTSSTDSTNDSPRKGTSETSDNKSSSILMVKRAKSMDLGPATRLLAAKNLVPKANIRPVPGSKHSSKTTSSPRDANDSHLSPTNSPKGFKSSTQKSSASPVPSMINRKGSSPAFISSHPSSIHTIVSNNNNNITGNNAQQSSKESSPILSTTSNPASPGAGGSSETNEAGSLNSPSKKESKKGSTASTSEAKTGKRTANITPPRTNALMSSKGSKKTLSVNLPSIQERDRAEDSSSVSGPNAGEGYSSLDDSREHLDPSLLPTQKIGPITVYPPPNNVLSTSSSNMNGATTISTDTTTSSNDSSLDPANSNLVRSSSAAGSTTSDDDQFPPIIPKIPHSQSSATTSVDEGVLSSSSSSSNESSESDSEDDSAVPSSRIIHPKHHHRHSEGTSSADDSTTSSEDPAIVKRAKSPVQDIPATMQIKSLGSAARSSPFGGAPKGFVIPKLSGIPSKGISLMGSPSLSSNGSASSINANSSSITPIAGNSSTNSDATAASVTSTASNINAATTPSAGSTLAGGSPSLVVAAPKATRPKLGIGLNLTGLSKGTPMQPSNLAAPASQQSSSSSGNVPKLNLISVPSKGVTANNENKLQKEADNSWSKTQASKADVNANKASDQSGLKLDQFGGGNINWENLESDPELEVTNRRPGERRYTLTSMENNLKMTSNVLKMQVVLDRHREETERADEIQNKETPYMARLEEDLYKNERDTKKIYSDTALHEAMLELLLLLLLSPDGNSLDPLYSSQYPVRDNKTNIPYILLMHLNHPANSAIVAPLCVRTHKRNNPSAFRMLKLLSTRFFQPWLYKDMVKIGDGSYGVVYACKMLGESVAVKQMPLPRSFGDRCVLHDIFAEILVLDKWQNDDRICTLIDYGMDDENYWVVMKKYRTSLGDWRRKLKKSWDANLPMLLNIYMDVLQKCRFLADNNVNHYDIKLDNFLLDPIDPEATNDELYNHAGKTANCIQQFGLEDPDMPYFNICIADFGEALVYSDELAGYTTDNRGTEFIKSPEMLNVAYAGRVERQTYDRRRKEGANRSSDVWSLGCLLYELLTCEFMFYDHDWVRFRQTVCSPNEELIKEKHKEKLKNNPHLIAFLQWVLHRDPTYRPTLSDLIQRFALVQKECMKDIQAKRKSFIYSDPNSSLGDRNNKESASSRSEWKDHSGSARGRTKSPEKELRRSNEKRMDKKAKRSSIDASHKHSKSIEASDLLQLSTSSGSSTRHKHRTAGITRSQSSRSQGGNALNEKRPSLPKFDEPTRSSSHLSSQNPRTKSETDESKSSLRSGAELRALLEASSTSCSSPSHETALSAREHSKDKDNYNSKDTQSTPRKKQVSLNFSVIDSADDQFGGSGPTTPTSSRTDQGAESSSNPPTSPETTAGTRIPITPKGKRSHRSEYSGHRSEHSGSSAEIEKSPLSNSKSKIRRSSNRDNLSREGSGGSLANAYAGSHSGQIVEEAIASDSEIPKSPHKITSHLLKRKNHSGSNLRDNSSTGSPARSPRQSPRENKRASEINSGRDRDRRNAEIHNHSAKERDSTSSSHISSSYNSYTTFSTIMSGTSYDSSGSSLGGGRGVLSREGSLNSNISTASAAIAGNGSNSSPHGNSFPSPTISAKNKHKVRSLSVGERARINHSGSLPSQSQILGAGSNNNSPSSNMSSAARSPSPSRRIVSSLNNPNYLNSSPQFSHSNPGNMHNMPSFNLSVNSPSANPSTTPPLSDRTGSDSSAHREFPSHRDSLSTNGESMSPDTTEISRMWASSAMEKPKYRKALQAKVLHRRILSESDLPLERIQDHSEIERSYFDSELINITPYLLIGSYESLKHKLALKRKYGVTHIINCTSLQNPNVEHFDYMTVNIADKPNALLTDYLTRIFQFVHAAFNADGRVLVVGQPEVKAIRRISSRLGGSSASGFGFGGNAGIPTPSNFYSAGLYGSIPPFAYSMHNSKSNIEFVSANSQSCNLAVAICVAILMENQHASFFEAFQKAYQRRYISQISLHYVQQLIDWDASTSVTRNMSREQYSCLCKANTITMLQPFYKNVARKTLNCNCKNNGASGVAPMTPCPIGDCNSVLSEFSSFNLDHYIKWSFVSMDDIVRDVDYVDEFNPPAPPTRERVWSSSEQRAWRAYRCRKCNFLTHAIHRLDPTVMAVCSNIVSLLDG